MKDEKIQFCQRITVKTKDAWAEFCKERALRPSFALELAMREFMQKGRENGTRSSKKSSH
jgi:hypothetical protein